MQPVGGDVLPEHLVDAIDGFSRQQLPFAPVDPLVDLYAAVDDRHRLAASSRTPGAEGAVAGFLEKLNRSCGLHHSRIWEEQLNRGYSTIDINKTMIIFLGNPILILGA